MTLFRSVFPTMATAIVLSLAMLNAAVAAPPIAAPDNADDSVIPGTGEEKVEPGDAKNANADNGNGVDGKVEPLRPFNAAMDGSHVGWLTLRGRLYEGPRIVSAFGTTHIKGTLEGLIKQLTLIQANDKYKGIVIEFDGAGISAGQLYTIQKAIAKIRKRGKKVLFVAEAYNTMTYALACTGDAILLRENGGIELNGPGGEEIYLAGLFEKIGVKADLIQVGRFKGADEQQTRTKPTKHWDRNIDALLDDIYAQMLEHIGEHRKLSREEADKLFKDWLVLDNQQWVDRKAVDHIVNSELNDVSDGKTKVAEQYFGTRFEWDESIGLKPPAVAASSPMDLFKLLFQPKPSSITGPSIVVIHINGPIMSGDSSDGGLFGSRTIGSRTVIKALRQARDDTHVKGVVLRIDSPGGSALASDMIWQSVRQLVTAELEFDRKPVYVSIGGMAASGGYYIGCAGERVFAEPGSIVGSIGVVGGKMAMGELMNKLGVNIVDRSRGPAARMFSPTKPFTIEERELMKQSMRVWYRRFTDRIASGRPDKIKDMDAVAHGRLFTGRQCMDNGLVDAMGGLDVAIRELAKHPKVNLKPGNYKVVDLPEPPSFAERVGGLLQLQAPIDGVIGGAPQATLEHIATIRAARQLLGERRWQSIAATLTGLTALQRERVLAIMPVAVHLK